MIFAWGNDAKVFFYNTNVLTVLLTTHSGIINDPLQLNDLPLPFEYVQISCDASFKLGLTSMFSK